MAIVFDQLVGALARAVVDAQKQVRQTHLGEVSKYFLKDGSPISVKLTIPRVSPVTGRQEPVEVSVPLMTLVNQSQMSIKEMQVTMQVDMTEIAKAVEKKKSPNASEEKIIEQSSEWKQPAYQPLISASTTTGKKPGDVGLAQVTLRITAEETPEGLARLLDQLNKCL